MEELIVSLHNMNLQNPLKVVRRRTSYNVRVQEEPREPTKEVLGQAVQYLFNENVKLKEEIKRLRQCLTATPTIPLWIY